MLLIPTPDRSSAEAPPQLVLAGGQGNGVPGVTDICAPRPGSKKLHVKVMKCVLQNYYWVASYLLKCTPAFGSLLQCCMIIPKKHTW